MGLEVSLTDREALQLAKSLLDNPGLAAKITNYLGAPIDKGLELLPASWNKSVSTVTQAALLKASDAAIFTLQDAPFTAPSNRWHKLSVAFSGGVGGFFGLSAVAVELPLSTTIMLRSIADIARSEGESISDVETQVACLEVFALGGDSREDDGAETGYFAVRASLARSVSEAAEYLTRKGLSDTAAPLLVKLISKIAERFGVQVTQKAAAQAIPALGAAGGAIVNTLFIDHFQDMARGHFIVRRLEGIYGAESVQALYLTL